MSALSKLILAFFILLALLGILTVAFIIYLAENHNTEKVTIKGHVAVPANYLSNPSQTLKPEAAAPPAQGMVTASSQATRLSTTRCDPFACKPVANRPVRIVQPGRNGWTAVPVEPVMTDDNGDYTITVNVDVLTSGGPVYIAATDPTESYPLMATIPGDLIYAGTIELAIDRTTTAAAVMHCPGGMYPPPRGSYCYSDPDESTNIESLYAKIDLYFEENPSSTADPEQYIPDVSNDPGVQDEMDQSLTNNDQPEGFKPISMDNGHPLEGLGRVIVSGENPTTTRPTTPPRTIPPTTPPRTSPPRTTPPRTQPNGFPSDLPADGQYSISGQVCTYQGCQAWTQEASEADVNINEMINYLNQANQVCNNQEGLSCKISYSGWDGRTFTMTESIQACYQGQCSEASRVNYRMTRVG